MAIEVRRPGTGTASTPVSRISRSLADAGAGEHVRAEVDPVVAPRLGPDAAADAVGRLQHDDVAIAQVPGGREARNAPADHDHVVQFGHAGDG